MDTLNLAHYRQRLEERVLTPLTRTSKGYYLLVGFLLLVMAWAGFAYFTQVRNGLIVTGMRDRISWGLYITLFVFFIGISHAGTLISAILRTVKAGWRTPITRMAEFITVVALMVGALFPAIDLGRPDRIHHLLLFGRWQSPLLWDVFAITTYLTGSIIYLYLPLIPDFALCRDRLASKISPLKYKLYQVLSLGWRDTPAQKKYLGIAMTMMMILIIPVAVSVHTVVSWIFAMTLREPWNNPMFGAYFVAGAIFSGMATLILLMAILRKVYRLHDYIKDEHFIYLGYMLAGFTLIMGYFNASEYITSGYKMAGDVPFHFRQMFLGPLAPFYWFYAVGGLIVPGLIVLIPATRNMTGIVSAAVLVNIAMWMERYFIVVGGLRVPLMPYAPSSYAPTWVEWSIMAGAFAWFSLIIAIFVKIFPLLAVWEVAEHYEEERVKVPRRETIEALEPSPLALTKVEARPRARELGHNPGLGAGGGAS
ncbi:MAG: polysulfide reductase NrfD [Chloroflexi bacterium]|nr:polysulfide reductase NrfD [Chloroflexota bacterium]